jgi:lysozyme family protein
MYIDPNILRVLCDGLRREGWPAPARALPSDRGGLTRGGITAVNWGAFRRLGRSATKVELDSITETEALEFYYQRYVALPRFDQVLDQRLRALLVDWAFTSWYDDPTESLQRALASRGLYAGPVDGTIGPLTIAALQRDREPRRLYRDVFNDRVRFYVALALAEKETIAFIDARPSCQLRNLSGWLNRALEFTP